MTISVTRHDEPDTLLLGALNCLASQQGVLAAVLVFDQCSSIEIEQYCTNRPDGDVHFLYFSMQPCGISRARNQALQFCRTDLLLFTEPDARPDTNWAHYLSETLAGGAAVAGGRILPEWEGRPPIVAGSGLVMDMYSLLDLGDSRRASEKVVGCNFGINIANLGARYAYFDENLGRTPGTLMGGEEVDLCLRAANAGLPVMYDGRALVIHLIAKERSGYHWLARRIYSAGKSRAMKGGRPRTSNPLGIHWRTALAFPLYLIYVLGFLSYKREARTRLSANE